MKKFKLSFIFLLFLFATKSANAQLEFIYRIFIKDGEKILVEAEHVGAKGKIIRTTIEKSEVYEFFDKNAKKFNSFEAINEAKAIVEREFKNGVLRSSEYEKLQFNISLQQTYLTSLAIERKQKWNMFIEPQITLKSINRAEVFISIPTNQEEFINIFKVPNQNQLSDAKNIKLKLEKEKNQNVNFPSSAGLLLESIKQADNKEKSIIIIGHNDNGILYFPDGSSSSISAIDVVAKENNRVISYLSCNASDFTENPAPNYFLTYPEAISLATKLNFSVPIDFQKNSDEVKKIMQANLDKYATEKALKYKIKIITYSGTATAVGYGVYEFRK